LLAVLRILTSDFLYGMQNPEIIAIYVAIFLS
jgi:hypothetical protein